MSGHERRAYCECGHAESEHDRRYEWTSAVYCSGHVTAYDRDSEGEMSTSRGVTCLCSDFREADEWQLREWAEYGQLPAAAIPTGDAGP